MRYTKTDEESLLHHAFLMRSELLSIYNLIPSIKVKQKLLLLRRILDKLSELELRLDNMVIMIKSLIENLYKENNGST